MIRFKSELVLRTSPRRNQQFQSIFCAAVEKRKQLSWGTEAKPEIVSGRQIRRNERSISTSLPQQSLIDSVTHKDICDGIAWYNIKVFSRNEDLVAADLKRQISKLPPIESSSGVRKKRFIATWVPKKYMKFPTKKYPNGMRRAVKYGPMQGEMVLLECQMDEKVFDIVCNHPFVQGFANLHPFNSRIPLPCSDGEKLDAEDWIWHLDLPKTESGLYERVASKKSSEEEPYLDIAFAVDKLVNDHEDDIGFITVFDEKREAADELGVEWKERQKRELNRLRREEERQRRERVLDQKRREEQRFSKGRWKSRNFKKEREMAEMAEDYEMTKWFEGGDLETIDEDVKVPIEVNEEESIEQESLKVVNKTSTSSITVTDGPFADFQGVVLEKRDSHYLINVNVFGEQARVTLAGSQFRFNEE